MNGTQPIQKPTLILVHGSWHSPKHYKPIVQALESKHGFKCIAIDLPSTQTPDSPPRTLADDTKAIRDTVTAELDTGHNVLVIAHSFGGCPTNNALKDLSTSARKAAGEETSVLGIAFINSIPLPSGISFLDVLGGKPHALHDLRIPDFCWVGPPGPAHYFYNEMTPEDAEYWSKYLRQQSWPAYQEKTSYAAYMDFPCWYLSCTKDQAFPFEAQQGLIEKANGEGARIESVKLEGADHTPFIGKHMQETIEFIEDVVKKVS